jgi:hypothetical protein
MMAQLLSLKYDPDMPTNFFRKVYRLSFKELSRLSVMAVELKAGRWQKPDFALGAIADIKLTDPGDRLAYF